MSIIRFFTISTKSICENVYDREFQFGNENETDATFHEIPCRDVIRVFPMYYEWADCREKQTAESLYGYMGPYAYVVCVRYDHLMWCLLSFRFGSVPSTDD